MKSEIPPTVSEDTFDDSDIKYIQVPKGCRDAYISQLGWSKVASRIMEEEIGGEIMPEKVEIVTDIPAVRIGQTVQLLANVLPTNATDKSVVWSSSDTGVATVDENGLVAAVSVGSAIITATTVNGLTAECTVTVVPTPVESITLNHAETTLRSGETLQLTATLLPEDATDKSVVWSSSDAGVATVDKNGLTTAVSVGTAIITATSVNGLTAECMVTVSPTPVESVTLNLSEMTLKSGETLQLTATLRPENATDKSVVWVSSDTGVVIVDENGLVTAVSVGTAIITATSVNDLTAKCTVTVSPTPVESITLNHVETTLRCGETLQLTATLHPENATDRSVVWSSSDTGVATVDENGLVTALSIGTAVIKATTLQGVSDECKIIVEVTPVSKVVIDEQAMGVSPDGKLNMRVGDTKAIIATVEPENAIDIPLSYESDNSDVVYVDENGNIKALSVGIATVVVKGGTDKVAYLYVRVLGIDVESVSLNLEDVELKTGETVQLFANVLPENAIYKKILWYTSNSDVATVDDNGLVKARDVGVAVIKVDVGGKTAKCYVTVAEIPVTNIGFDRAAMGISGNDLVMNIGEKKEIMVAIEPENASDKYIIYKTSDSDVAYAEYGYIHTCNTGFADITVTVGPDVSDTIRVWVIKDNGDKFSFKANGINYNIDKKSNTASVGDNKDYSGVNLIIPEHISYLYMDYPVTAIESNAFYRAKIDGELRLPDGLITIGENAFYHCGGLTGDLVIPNSVTALGKCAFYSCFGFNGILKISESLSVIEDDVFIGCSALTGNLLIPNSVSIIGNRTFSGCTGFIGDFRIPDSVSRIGECAFGECSGLTGTLRLPDSLSEIGDGAFVNCSGFTGNLRIPGSVVKIGTCAFEGCSGLNGSLVIGEGVAEIGQTGFDRTCFNSIDLPSSLTSIGDNAFNLGYVAENMTIISRASNPPVLNSNAFVDKQVASATLYVPMMSMESYENKWGLWGLRFKEIKAIEGEIPERVELNETTSLLSINQHVQLVATVYPDDSFDKSIVWTSSNVKVATVDENGLVTAVSYGTAVITATTINGLTAKCYVGVTGIPVESVTLNHAEATLRFGETLQLTATLLPDDATHKSVTWESSNMRVAFVDENGLVTAISGGIAVITATSANRLKAECVVTVVPTPVESVTLNHAEATLKSGETLQLIATLLPEDATDKTVSWSSSDAAVARVVKNGNGLVTALSIGTTVISATSYNGLKAECVVTVVPTPVESVTLNHAEATLKSGETLQLTATWFPENANDKSVAWSSSDAAIATVTKNGLITAVSVGTAVVTATSANGLTAECTVTVVPTPVESVTLNHAEATLKSGETLQLTATLLPDDATDKTVTWASSDAGVATVDETGLMIAVSVGTAVVTATSANGLTAECTVTVVPTSVESVTLNHAEANLRFGETLQLTATLLPDDAIDKWVVWSSSDTGVVTVDETGLVVAVSVGTAVVTATSANGLTAECTVTVVPTPVESVTLNHAEANLRFGETLQLTATLLPDDATERTVTWASSDAGVATVDENGLVTAVATGTAVITATTVNALKADCVIKVVNSEYSGATDVYGDDGHGNMVIRHVPGGIEIEGTNRFETAIDIFNVNGISIRHYDVDGGEQFREKIGKVSLTGGIYIVRAISRNYYFSQKIKVN